MGAGTRWLGVGRSTAGSAALAGREATAAALDGRADGRLLVVLASDGLDLPALLAAVRSVSGGVPLIGCSTAGEITGDGPTDASAVVLALGGDGFSVATAAADATGEGGLRAAGAAVAESMSRVPDGPHRALLLLSDGLAGDQEELVRGAYGVLGAQVPLVGGCAGDDLRMERTSQLHGDQVLHGSVVAAALSSDAPLGIGVSHGWQRTGEPMLVTASEGNLVLALDEEPALDVYLSRLGAPPEAHTDPAAFTRFALTHPLGLHRRRSDEVRFIAGADFETRALSCVAHVPQGALTWFMEGDDASVLRATDSACSDAVAALGGSAPLGLLAFDCIARRGVLGEDGLPAEVGRLSAHAAGGPVAGFYTYGEIARTTGTGGFHNQTLVVLAVG